MQRDASGAGADRYDEEYFAERLGEPYSRDNPVWTAFFGHIADWIVDEFAPRSVLDAGCAIGFLVEALRDRGVDARGFDISEYAIAQVPEALRPYCALASITDEIAGSFDLITCIEVLEHLPPEDAEMAIDNLTHHTDRILFSSSPDDDKEPTHVNVRQPDEWVRAFAPRGFFPTAKLASVVAPQAVVFERGEPAVVDVLAANERARYKLARDLSESMTASAANAAELSRVQQLLRSSEAIALEQQRDASAAIAGLERRAAAAEKASVELGAALDKLRETTWWRAGRPFRGAVTFVRAQVLPRSPRLGPRPGEGQAPGFPGECSSVLDVDCRSRFAGRSAEGFRRPPAALRKCKQRNRRWRSRSSSRIGSRSCGHSPFFQCRQMASST